ncbi:hypothetical protein AB6A40_011539 [Gnathostoma spinigerum]|uniref:Uncharacterized protein n=1 Tax=Gnathostoma spinigerum TaxID=75299 RepID=A0ABD6EXZ9_9BILA
MSNVSQSFHYRLLPKSALSDVSHLLKHPTIMVVYDKESLRPLPSFRVVFVKQMGASSSSSFFALLLSVPGKCPSHQSLSDVLKNYQNHCAVSSSMFCYECNQYKWFRCKTLPKSMLIMLRNVDVVPSNDKMCPDPDEMVGVIEAHLRSSCNYYPVVMKSDGIRMVIDVKGSNIISLVYILAFYLRAALDC